MSMALLKSIRSLSQFNLNLTKLSWTSSVIGGQRTQERQSHNAPPSMTFRLKDKPIINEPERWPLKNYLVYEPQKPDEPRRRAMYHHVRSNIKYSPKKMWYICCLIRGLSIDEAIKQLSFVPKKGAVIAKEVLQEAQEIAIREHGFEFKSNMFVGECFATKGLVVQSIRKHARYRFGEIRHFHCHFYVKLVEGPPPKFHYHENYTNREKLDRYLDDLKKRRIKFTI